MVLKNNKLTIRPISDMEKLSLLGILEITLSKI